MQPLFLLSTLFSLFYAWQGVRLARTLWARREALRQEPLQPWQKGLAEQAAFLLAIPPGVVIHELGHALAIWGFGGRVIDWGYWLYWGFVTSAGTFSAAQDWFISLAGTLGSLFYAGLLALLLLGGWSSALRYFLLRALRFQLYYALLYYPIFTLITFIGDWRVIYDFNDTPLFSGATAVVHAVTLFIFWRADRQGHFEMVAHQTLADQQAFEALRARQDANPSDFQNQLALIDRLRLGGAEQLARIELEQFLKAHPHSPEGHLQLAALQSDGKQQVPRQARANFRRALELGLSNPAHIALAHLRLGEYAMGVERADEALRHFDDGLAALSSAPVLAEIERLRAHLYNLRASVHQRRGNIASAQDDLKAAIRHASATGDPNLVAHYQQERSGTNDQG